MPLAEEELGKRLRQINKTFFSAASQSLQTAAARIGRLVESAVLEQRPLLSAHLEAWLGRVGLEALDWGTMAVERALLM
jgi:hypothetical protein